jgi:hypothetical protein
MTKAPPGAGVTSTSLAKPAMEVSAADIATINGFRLIRTILPIPGTAFFV